MLKKKIFTTAAGILFVSLLLGAQTLDDKILPRKEVVENRLDNGLSYMVSHNDSPSRMIECRLIFKAGSILEDEGNRGAAHFLEHMAFGGTRHFPKHELVDYLESLGAQYGISINAYTGYDRTIYMFAIPSDESAGLDNALKILRDWLVDITLEPKKVDGEKGIILEELRGYDVGDDFYDLKIGTGKYSEGIPLGTAEQISAITPKILRDFHRKWYTLGQATVAVVGDVDVDDVQRRIHKTFGPLKASSSPEYRDYCLDYAAGTTVKSINDTLVQRMSVEMIIPHTATFKRTLADAVQAERARMLLRAAGKRLSATGCNASLSNHWYLADKEHFVISTSGRDKAEAETGLTDAVAELHHIVAEGFCPGEMKEIRKAAKSMTRLPRGESSAMLCEELSEAALFDDRIVTDPGQLAFLRKELENTTSADLQNMLAEWLDAAENTRLVACTFNAHASDEITTDDIDRLWAEAKCRECKPFVYEEIHERPAEKVAVPDFLAEQKPYDPSMVYAKTYYPNIGVTSVYLNNGFRFVLRPTADEEHKIQMQLFAPGGFSRIPEDEFPVYEGIASQMDMSGIEKMDEDEFATLLMQNEVGIITTMENYWHGFIASAPKESSMLMFNAIKERMYRPKLNYASFEEMKQSDLEDFESGEESYLSRLLKNDVQRQLNMRIDSLMGNLLYGRRTELTREDIERRNLDLMVDFYKKLYCNPDGMTCVICGDFDVDTLMRQAVPVFADMQKTGEPNRMGNSHFNLPVTTRHITYPNANESQTLFDYIRFGQYEPSLRSGLKLKLMNNLIRNRLLSVLREQESLVYSPYASLFYNAAPDKIFYIDINASVDRQNTKKVHKILDSIINDLQRHPATERELNTLKRIFIVNKRNALEENATAGWKGYLVGQMKNDETLVELDMYEDVLESITAEELRREFIKCFDTDRYMILSMGDF
ncbi:MAG: M16 family metallopeptidase [Candidatus Cryptobacteroides sp.]